MIYNYYVFAMSINSHLSTTVINKAMEFIYLLFMLSPFTFSSLVRPLGGIFTSWLQIKFTRCILPIMLIAFSSLGLILGFLGENIYHENTARVILAIRIIQGLILGGLIPQYFIIFYEKSTNISQKIFYCSGIFAAIYMAVICSGLVIYCMSLQTQYCFNIGVDILFISLSFKIYLFRHELGDFTMDSIPATQSFPLWITLKSNYGSIIRFAMFLSFMASLNSFFLTVMPFYLVRFLHYKPKEVFVVLIITSTAALIGFYFGGYYHDKIGKKCHLALGLILKLILYILFRVYLHHNLLMIETFGSMCMFCLGLMLAKTPLILNSIFPARSRLQSLALTYNLSHGLLFGLSGFIIVILINHFHNLYIPSLFILFFSYMSLISLWFTPEKDFYRYLDK